MIFLIFVLLIGGGHCLWVGTPTTIIFYDDTNWQPKSTLITMGTETYGPVMGYLPRPVRFIAQNFYVDGLEPGSITPIPVDENGAISVGEPHYTGGDGATCFTIYRNPGGREAVLVVNEESQTIALLNTINLNIFSTSPTGADPRGVYIGGSIAFVPCRLDDTIYQYIIDLDTWSLMPLKIVHLFVDGDDDNSRTRVGPSAMAFDIFSQPKKAFVLTERKCRVLVYLYDSFGLSENPTTIIDILSSGTQFGIPGTIAWENISKTLGVTIGVDSFGYLVLISDNNTTKKYTQVGNDIPIVIENNGRFFVGSGTDGTIALYTPEGELIKMVEGLGPLISFNPI